MGFYIDACYGSFFFFSRTTYHRFRWPSCALFYGVFVFRVQYLFVYFVLRINVWKNAAAAPAESGYPCRAWLGRHSEIDVILITREVAYHKSPGPVRPFVLCTRRCYTHTRTRTLFPIDRLSLSLSPSLSLSRTLSPLSVSKCASPLETPKTMRRVGVCVCVFIIYFIYIIHAAG